MKLADLTIEQLRDLIREIMDEKLKEFLFDPDYGLELRRDVEERLTASLASRERISLDQVKKRLGVSEL